MKARVLRRLLFALGLLASQTYGQGTRSGDTDQVTRLIEASHARINGAAEAAKYISEGDQHRQHAERLVATGHQPEAREELQLSNRMQEASRIAAEPE